MKNLKVSYILALAAIIAYMSPCVLQFSASCPFLLRLLAQKEMRVSSRSPSHRVALRGCFSCPLPEVVGLGMLLLLEGLLELALLARVLVDASTLLGVAQCRPGVAVGVQAVGARRILGLFQVVRHGPVDLVSRADGHRHCVVALVLLLLVVAPLGRLVGVRQPLMVWLGVSSRVVAVVLSSRVGQVLEVDVGAMRVPLALAVGCPVVDQGVTLKASFVPGYRAQGVLLDVLQLLLATVFLVVVEALLAVLVGLVQLAPGVAALQFAVSLLLGVVLLRFVVVCASERGQAGKGDQHDGRQV